MYAFFYGCIFGIVRIVTGNLIYTIIMHICFNAWNVVVLYIKDEGIVQSDGEAWIVAVWIAVVVLSMLVCGILIRFLCRTNNVRLAKEGNSAGEFISKEGLIAFAICICITIIMRMGMN